jgi:hypothetical protein
VFSHEFPAFLFFKVQKMRRFSELKKILGIIVYGWFLKLGFPTSPSPLSSEMGSLRTVLFGRRWWYSRFLLIWVLWNREIWGLRRIEMMHWSHIFALWFIVSFLLLFNVYFLAQIYLWMIFFIIVTIQILTLIFSIFPILLVFNE